MPVSFAYCIIFHVTLVMAVIREYSSRPTR